MRVSEHSIRHFTAVSLEDGLLADLSDCQHPTNVYGWGKHTNTLELDAGATHYGFVAEGTACIQGKGYGCERSYNLGCGMYFSMPGAGRIEGGRGVVISRLNLGGVFLLGGPIEQTGRLRYIDGCTDSLLIPPVLKGDPCLNHLHFPCNVRQTLHTHPSIRIGMVVRGKGQCIVPGDYQDSTLTVPLIPGEVFIIPVGGQHGFVTSDESMDINAYHPDSDTGPEHDNHPVLNRTFVSGVSATNIDAIRTRK